jgi:hypothetical protein
MHENRGADCRLAPIGRDVARHTDAAVIRSVVVREVRETLLFVLL